MSKSPSDSESVRPISGMSEAPIELTRSSTNSQSNTDSKSIELDDLAVEVQTLSSRLLDAEDARSRLEEQFRALSKDATQWKSRAAEAEAFKTRVQELEDEMSDFSTNLLDEANRQVEAANRRAGAFQKLVEERDVILETQQAQLDILKAMVEAAPPPPDADPRKNHPDIQRTRDEEIAVLVEYGTYASPARPIMRLDTRDFSEFCALAMNAKWKTSTFGRRVINEDVIPTLRLETSEHLSWLARRSWLQATLDGTLIIEPVPPSERVWASRPSHPCVICSENRHAPQYRRMYQTRVPGESSPFALGLECHARVRLACEFASFIRSIADGMRKMDKPEQQRRCWEECMYLREQMFWSRTAGLFPPAAHTSIPPPIRDSSADQEVIDESNRAKEASQAANIILGNITAAKADDPGADAEIITGTNSIDIEQKGSSELVTHAKDTEGELNRDDKINGQIIPVEAHKSLPEKEPSAERSDSATGFRIEATPGPATDDGEFLSASETS